MSQNGKSKHCLHIIFFIEYSISFRVVSRRIVFALVTLKLLIFKVRAVISISKIEFFKFSGTDMIKKNQTQLKAIQNLLIM